MAHTYLYAYDKLYETILINIFVSISHAGPYGKHLRGRPCVIIC